MFAKVVIHPGIQKKPFFFADCESCEDKMLNAATGVVALKLGAA